MWNGSVVGIFISPVKEKQLVSVGEVRAIPGKGIEGDRYFNESGTYSDKRGPSQEVTLIEVESIEALKRDFNIDFGLGESRRNIVTRGVPLNHLVGKEFSAGGVRLKGIRVCEPCDYLEKLTGKKILQPLLHRGGLRAQVLKEGIIRVGDSISE